ncbi:hypothetical protein AB1Y20_008873 [Prymnesium parvum]|uniref:Uncharacterized protein n=1 Tax=Prymnesium parvum TaxID=97485 RepID=A0AB34ITL1_PRYPA
MFEKRPLPLRLFTYSIEDVIYCNQLFAKLREALVDNGYAELCDSLCSLRQPESFLPPPSPAHVPPTRLVTALVDARHVLCLEHLVAKTLSLPSIAYAVSSDDPPDISKRLARQAWLSSMGPVPKAYALEVNQKMKRQIRLRDTLLYSAAVPSCATALRSLSVAFVASPLSATHRLVAVDLLRSPLSTVADEAFLPSLQYLRQNAEMADERSPSIEDVYPPLSPTGPIAPAYHVSLSLRPDGGRVAVGVHLVLATPHISLPLSEVNVVLGPVVKNNRGALILLDDTHVYTLQGNSAEAPLTFPSHQVEVHKVLSVGA